MKKYNTLKAVVAILLVFHMLILLAPISSYASSGPVIEEFSVGSASASISDKNIDAKVFTSDITDNKIQVYFAVNVANYNISYEGESLANGGMMDLTKFMYNAGVYRTELLIRDSVTNLASMYNLNVEVTYASGDTSIASIDFTGSVGTIKADYQNQSITGTVLYGLDLSEYTKADFNIALTEQNRAHWDWNPISEEIIVTAENGNMTAYSFDLTAIDGLTDFTIYGAASSEIDQARKTITIEMPYTSEYEIPTVSLKAEVDFNKTIPASTVSSGDLILHPNSTKAEWIEAVNGEIPLTVSFKKDNKTYEVTYTVKIVYPLNPNAQLKEIEVVSASNSIREVGEIKGSTITAQIGKGSSLENAKLFIKASQNATVKIPMQGIEKTVLDETGYTELPNVNLQGEVAIQVISEDEKIISKYTLLVTQRSTFTEPNILFMALKDVDGNVYNAEIQDTQIVIKGFPFNTNNNELADMSLIYTLSNGSELYDSNDAPVARSGTKLGSNIGLYIPDSVHTITKTSLAVAAQDEDNRQTKYYTVAIEANKAMEGNSIHKINITLPGSDMQNEVVIDGQVTTEKDTAGISKNVATFTIPYDIYHSNDYIHINEQLKKAKPTLELSEGAAAYYYDENRKLFVLMQSGTKGSKGVTLDFENANTLEKAKNVYILSEEVAYRIAKYMGDSDVQENDFDTFLSSFASSKYRKYCIYAGSSTARKGTDMNSFSIDNTNVTIDHSYQLIKLTIPWSYTSTDLTGVIPLIPNFTLSGGAGLWTDVSGTKGSGFKFTSGGNFDTSGNWVKKSPHLAVTKDSSGKYQMLYYFNGDEYIQTDGLYVVNEGGTAFKKYNFQIDIAAPESGSVFTSFSLAGVNGNINGSKISVILPYNTNVNALTPDFTVSKMASVQEHIYGGTITSGTDKIDFTNDVRLTVLSEDGKNKTIYTISVSKTDAFTDVRQSDWFYTEVMQAAAAGIINGVGNGYFRPNNTVTRGDFAVMIARMLDADLDSVTTNPFTDVPSGAYYFKAIVYGYEAGYLGGYEDGSFRPKKTITRQEMAKIFKVVLNLEYEKPTTLFSDDNKIAGWAKEFVYACKNAGLMEGTDNVFNPLNTASRAQAATVIVRSWDIE